MKFTREDVSRYLDKVRNKVPNPLWLAGGLGLAGAGLTLGTWENIIQTGGSLGRYPIRKMTGMTDDEYDEAMNELSFDNRYRFIIPAAVGSILAGGYLASKYNPYMEGKGLKSWTPKVDYSAGATKKASLDKVADELWSYGGYVPEIDFSKVINARDAKSMFTNAVDLKDDPYVRNSGVAIISDASNRAGYANPTLGNIYDSARDKFKQKLSFNGLHDIALTTMIANASAHLFTGALGAVMPLSSATRRTIQDSATWGAAITSILK